jgi:serine/threonine-protein kinase
LTVDLGEDALTGPNITVAISPDGRRLVFPVRGPNGKPQLATRRLEQSQFMLLPGTENGFDPFFSPDGQWLGFFGDGKLEKISLEGGRPVPLCAAANPRGASWGADGYIVAALSLSNPLLRLSDAGGNPQPLTKLRTGESTHRWPQILPGGEVVVFTASAGALGYEDATIEALSLKTGEIRVLQRGGYYGRYLPSGHLVYVHQGALFGVAFDPEKLEVRGPPVRLLEDVASNPLTGGGQFSFSEAPSDPGTLLYLVGKGAPQHWQVSWLERSGTLHPLIETPGLYAAPHISPDGRKLAFNDRGAIYTYDLQRGMTTRLTVGLNVAALAWAPDAKHIVFGSSAGGFRFFWIRSDGAGEPQRLLERQYNVVVWSISPDGGSLAYQEMRPETGFDIWTLPLDTRDPDHPRPGEPQPFLRTPANELAPVFSPDRRWIAYRSDKSGMNEIYVRPFPASTEEESQISAGGGRYAMWAKNGHELFYETADRRIMVVDYNAHGNVFDHGKPRLWSERQIFYPGLLNLDLAPDGKRFAVLNMPDASRGEKESTHVVMLENFFDELRRRMPAPRR